MRATEFIDFLNRDTIDDVQYSHIEIRDLDTGKIKEVYKNARKEYRKNIKSGEQNDNTRQVQG